VPERRNEASRRLSAVEERRRVRR